MSVSNEELDQAILESGVDSYEWYPGCKGNPIATFYTKDRNLSYKLSDFVSDIRSRNGGNCKISLKVGLGDALDTLCVWVVKTTRPDP